MLHCLLTAIGYCGSYCQTCQGIHVILEFLRQDRVLLPTGTIIYCTIYFQIYQSPCLLLHILTEDLPTIPTSLLPQTYLRHQIITCMLQPSSWCLSFFMAKSPANIKIREAGTASVLSTNAILIMHARILMFNHPSSLVDYVSHTPGEKLWLRSCPGSKQWFIVTYLYECRAMNHGTHTKLIKKATFLIVIV